MKDGMKAFVGITEDGKLQILYGNDLDENEKKAFVQALTVALAIYTDSVEDLVKKLISEIQSSAPKVNKE